MTTGTGGDRPLALRLLLKLLTRLRVGRLRLVAPDGTPYLFEGDPGPEAVIILRHMEAARRVLFGGDLGLAEAYMDGQWETPDLMAFLEFGLRNMQALSVDRPGLLHRLFDSLVHALRRNTRRERAATSAIITTSATLSIGCGWTRPSPTPAPSSTRQISPSRTRSATNTGTCWTCCSSTQAIISWRSAPAGAVSPCMRRERPAAG